VSLEQEPRGLGFLSRLIQAKPTETHEMPKMNWLCFGAGAIGTYVGGSLVQAGENVVFVEQPAAVEILRSRGLRLDLTVDPHRKDRGVVGLNPTALRFVSSLEEALRYGPFDIALFALKSFDTAPAIEGLRPFVERMPPICCFSNGVDNEPALANLFGTERVISCTVTTSIGRRGPGDIVVERLRGMGIHSTHPLSNRLVSATNTALLNARPYRNAAAMKWSKLLTNLVANPTSAILDMTAAEILSHSGLYQLEVGLMRECLAVMRAQRIPVVDLPGIPVRSLALVLRLPSWASKPFLARAIGAGRGGKMPSFHIDLYAGRGRSEVEYLHGAVVRAGEKHGIPTPINALLTETLVSLTRGEITRETFAHQPEKLLAVLNRRMVAR
jgi:2-dehydropantoate 2-reductase